MAPLFGCLSGTVLGSKQVQNFEIVLCWRRVKKERASFVRFRHTNRLRRYLCRFEDKLLSSLAYQERRCRRSRGFEKKK